MNNELNMIAFVTEKGCFTIIRGLYNDESTWVVTGMTFDNYFDAKKYVIDEWKKTNGVE